MAVLDSPPLQVATAARTHALKIDLVFTLVLDFERAAVALLEQRDTLCSSRVGAPVPLDP